MLYKNLLLAVVAASTAAAAPTEPVAPVTPVKAPPFEVVSTVSLSKFLHQSMYRSTLGKLLQERC